jgi:hypothetical protein
VLHGAVAVVGALLTLALLTEHVRWRPFAAFVGLKTVTAAASARFHLAPFLTAHAARRALILDLICVPCSIWGNACLIAYTPIQPAFRGDAAGSALSAGMHTALAGCFVINGLLVWYQFSGNDGGGDGGGGGDGVATDHAVLGQLVGVVLRAVKNELTKHHRLVNNWRRQEEFFHMLKQILALPSVPAVPAVPAVPSSSPEPSLPSLYQHYLYDIGLMEGLLGYFIGGCLKGMATWVSIVNNPQYGKPNFVPVSAGGGW